MFEAAKEKRDENRNKVKNSLAKERYINKDEDIKD